MSAYGQNGLSLVDRFGVFLSQRPIRNVIAKYASPDVLDVGCGYEASQLRGLAPIIGSGVGIDARVSDAAKSTPKLRFVEGTAEEALPSLEPASFDVVTMISVLEHLWEPLEPLRHCRRVLRSGGSLVLNVPNWLGKEALELTTFRLKLSKTVDAVDDHKTYYDKRDLWPLLVKVGFKIERNPHEVPQVRTESLRRRAHAVTAPTKSRVTLRTMIKLYGPSNRSATNTLKIRAALAAAGVDYQYVVVDLAGGEQRKPEYVALNPHGKVPLLVDDGFALPESDAILFYVGEKFSKAKLVPNDVQPRAQVIRWLDFASTGIYPVSYDLFSNTSPKSMIAAEHRSPFIADRARTSLDRALAVLESHVATHDWMVGGQVTIADYAIAAVVHMVKSREQMSATAYPHIEAYSVRVGSTPAWKKALEATP